MANSIDPAPGQTVRAAGTVSAGAILSSRWLIPEKEIPII